MDVDAEREKITQEIKELERILDPSSSSVNVEVSESSLDSDSEADSLSGEDSDAAGPPISEEERWGEASNEEDDPKEKMLPEDPETCLQLNMVYQEVVQEKLAEVSLLLAQNREQQEEVMWDLAGSKGPKVKDGKSPPLNLYIGHFLKPYFKDRVTGVGPPANEDAREKAAQGIKTFAELLVTKWKSWEKALLRKSVVSDRLQRLLQPKLLKLEYLQQKQSRVSSAAEKQVLEKQIQEAEKEIQDINQLQEEVLLGSRLDSHDWEKISNVNFEGGRSAEEIRKFWQNWEHPSINKQEWTGQEVEQLKAIAAKHGHLHWQKIAEELGTSRSAFQCLQKYQQHSKALRRREWTEEEDRMLTQLVQEMRVGSHIPYRRIVYYMEGRDSMQLTYRWTKSLDPSLRKGLWAPEEDAKLLQAVAKYGEQDWFKIREEVPGRSDAQCRDRYLRKLHFSLKKGRWNSKEEEKLIELIEKHGVGHWAKIASELPHRTGSQCLSKWKVMVRKRQGQGRRRQRRLRSVRWSSTSEDSSSKDSGDSSSEDSGDSEDSKDIGNLEPEETPDTQEDGQAPPPALHMVPDMALWVPARQSGRGPRAAGAGGRPGRLAALPSPLKVFDVAQGGGRNTEQAGQAQAPSGTHSTNGPRGTGHPRCADMAPVSSKGPADEGGGRALKEPLETVLRALGASTATQCRTPERLKQPCLLGSPQGTVPSGSISARPRVQGLWRRHRRHALQRRLLERRLLMAMSPWVGDVTPPCTPQRPSMSTRADSIQAQLQDARLASTPVFTLFIQLFQIDTTGCMEVVRERRAQLPTLPTVGAQAPSSAQDPPGGLPSSGPARDAAKKSAGHRGSAGLQTCRAESASQAPPPAPSGPRPKPKTVSELLREKRLREARASKAARGPVVLPPQLLVSSPVVLQAQLPLASQGPPAPAVTNSALSGPRAPAAASLSPSGSGASASDKGPPALQPLASAAVSLEAAKGTAASSSPHLGSSLVSVDGLGQSQAPATSRKQGLPEALPFLPAAPSPIQLPIQPLSLMPALGTHRGGPQVAASTPLPVTWVLTAQGLLPVPMPALVGLPGPAGTSDPKGLSSPSLSLTETRAGQGPTTMDRESAPPSKTDLATLLPPQISAEVDADVSRAPGGHSFSREVGVAGETAARAAVLASPPGAEAPCTSQLPLHGGAGLGGTLASPSEPRETQAPLGLEGPPAAQLGPERGGLPLGLLSQESEMAVREWLGGLRGVCVPPLSSRLPYQPPALCSLRALSRLLLHKKALEHRATSLGPGRAAGPLQASLGHVRRQLQDSPAYLLLRARFLAAFTLPALLATLSPPGVSTTLSVAARADSEREDQDLEGLEPIGSHGPLAGPAATAPVQGAPDPGEGSAPSYPDGSEDLDVLRTRHGQHARKRRRLL
ncbi:snRNA-activating protein complex subunit 4 isoform X2 [Sturnira hondurensis]|nr:snRNA-activating protein complex subunit 4 isoform X2 [Sturnira hondurensis]XP_036892510.1 snRNA-activating protein complex subunit 4 isoform X2 [Sturnira hondurensis]XP_036892511.1 snRNA-activating protein complex subunit 4 isoform X2 [Sturnira hondurensis]